jgi:hypothetical protein
VYLRCVSKVNSRVFSQSSVSKVGGEVDDRCCWWSLSGRKGSEDGKGGVFFDSLWVFIDGIEAAEILLLLLQLVIFWI